MYDNKLFEKLCKVNEFGYEAKYREIEKLDRSGMVEVFHMLRPLGWGEDEIKQQVMAAFQRGVYLLKREGKTVEKRDLPGRITIEMLSFDDDDEEPTLVSNKVEARFDPNDPTETLFIADDTFEGDSL